MDIDIKRIVVKFNNKVVGFLQELENSQIAFQYDDEWLRYGFSISPLSLPLSSKVYISKSPHFNGLFGVFNDSLPDGWGELLVRRMLAKKGINFDKLSPLVRLTLISGKGLGGLDYEPMQIENEKQSVDLDKLALEVKKILDDTDDIVDLDKVFDFGGSSGGARPKAHIKDENGEWIVKFPSSIDPVNIGELEHEANQTAQKCGINTNEFKLFPSKLYNGFFGAKRFDRLNDERIISLVEKIVPIAIESDTNIKIFDTGTYIIISSNAVIPNMYPPTSSGGLVGDRIDANLCYLRHIDMTSDRDKEISQQIHFPLLMGGIK